MHVFRSVYFVFVCVLCICGVRVGGVIPAEHLGCWPRGGALAWEATKDCWLFLFLNLCRGLASVLFFSISVVVKKDLYKLLLDMPVYFS